MKVEAFKPVPDEIETDEKGRQTVKTPGTDKILITTITNNLDAAGKLAFFNDVMVMRELFLKDGAQYVHVGANQSRIEWYRKDWCIRFPDIDLNKYNAIVFVITAPIVPKDGFEEGQMAMLMNLTRYLAAYKIHTYYYFNDINIIPFNVPTFLKYTGNDFPNSDALGLLDESVVLSSWPDYDYVMDLHKNDANGFVKKSDWSYLNLNRVNVASIVYQELIEAEAQTPPHLREFRSIKDRPYDFLFYSGNGKFRQRLERLEKYTSDFGQRDYIGLALKPGEEPPKNTDVSEKEPIKDIIRYHMPLCKFTLVFSCEKADGKIMTWRYYECMYGDTLAFILDEFDPNHEYVQNQELKDFIYIKDPEDLKAKVKRCEEDPAFYEKMVKLEKEEILAYVEV